MLIVLIYSIKRMLLIIGPTGLFLYSYATLIEPILVNIKSISMREIHFL